MRNKLITLLGLLILMTACSEKIKEAQNALEMAKSFKKVAENLEKNREGNSDKINDRRERGDTVAMHYEKLAEFLPESFKGYSTDGDLDGNSTNMAMMSFSSVTQKYVNGNGDKMKITIVDYNSAIAMYSGLMAFYGSGIEIDNTNERMKSFELNEDVKGWEVYKKKQNRIELFAGISERFYVTINADNQEGSDFAKDVLRDGLPLSEMVLR